MKKQPNIKFLLNMTNSFLNDKITSTEYWLDFPYELEKRYKKLQQESRLMAEVIYDLLVDNCIYLYDELTDEEFKEKVAEEYQEVLDIYEGRADLI